MSRRFEIKVIAEPQDDRFCGGCPGMAQAEDDSPLCVYFGKEVDWEWETTEDEEEMQRGGYERVPACIAAEKAQKESK